MYEYLNKPEDIAVRQRTTAERLGFGAMNVAFGVVVKLGASID